MSMICFQSTSAKGFNGRLKSFDWPISFVFRVINWPIIMQYDKSDYEIETRIYSFWMYLTCPHVLIVKPITSIMSMICFQRGSMGDWNLLIDPLICNWNWPLIITVHFKSSRDILCTIKVFFLWTCIFAFRNKKQIGFAVKIVLFCFQLKLFVLYLEIGQSFFSIKTQGGTAIVFWIGWNEMTGWKSSWFPQRSI